MIRSPASHQSDPYPSRRWSRTGITGLRAIGGRGRVQHAEFAFASGEMSEAQFRVFLSQTLSNGVSVSAQGSVHYVCIDWRHISELIEAGRTLERFGRHVARGAVGNLGAPVQ